MNLTKERKIKERSFHKSEIGESIQKHRVQSGLTVKELAFKLNLDPQLIRQMERGEKGVRLDVLIELSKIFDIDLNEIVFNTVSNPRETSKTQIQKDFISNICWNLKSEELDCIKEAIGTLKRLQINTDIATDL
ncbi:MAG: helix-turn-helix domain-containing protein [Defluviitaleaceae bacterium]|nr:helix-turn-helix domain-containing protein [Defluviitaleaceae bacterium]